MRLKTAKIKKELRRRGMTYADLARCLGVTRQALYHWLRREERLKTLDKIAKVLDVEARDLIE